MSTELAHRPMTLSEKFAARLQVSVPMMMKTLRGVAFRQPTKWNPETRRQEDGPEVTDEQMAALLFVADKYGLDPFTKEIYAFPDKGTIVPIVGIDGWIHLANSRPELDGIEFEYGPTVTLSPSRGKKDFKSGQMVYAEFGPLTGPEWVECIVHRKDRARAMRVREWLVECARDTDPWKVNTSRMLRHRALAQCVRVAFGFSGLHEEDEAVAMIDVTATAPAVAPVAGASKLAALGAKVAPAPITPPVVEPEAVPRTEAQMRAQVTAEAKAAAQRGATAQELGDLLAGCGLFSEDGIVEQVAQLMDGRP